MDRKKIILIIILLMFISGIFILALQTKNKPASQEQPEKLTKEQKEFADEFAKTMQAEKNKK